MKENKFILSFIKKNIFSLICLLLFILVLAMGSISYAKYIIKGTNDSQTNVGSFYFETSIDDVSGLSFTNTEFWSDSNSDKIALNVLRNLTFSVSNYENNGILKISDVKLKYNLSFAAPKNFVEVMAMQLFNNKNEPVIPQIVLSDLIGSINNQYNTSNSIDYNGTNIDDLVFNVQKYDNLIIASNDSVTITLEEYTKEIEQTLLFRMWDVSMLTSEDIKELPSEGGKVLSPLEITFNETVEFYKITISVDDFILPAKTETKDTYTIKLAPTKVVSDIHLGGVIVDSDNNKVSSIYGDETKKWTFSNGTKKSEIIIKQVKWSKLENGQITYLTYDKDNQLSFFEENIQKIYFSECYSKNYPFYTNVIFEQTQ